MALVESLESPRNLMALYGLILSAFCVMGWTCGAGVWGAPLGLFLSWMAFALGLGGRRHAQLHGHGGDLAGFALLIGGVNVLAYSAVCVAWSVGFLAQVIS